MIQDCDCHFCFTGQSHPKTHNNWFPISDKLLVPLSDKEEDRIKMEACTTCGHIRSKPHGG